MKFYLFFLRFETSEKLFSPFHPILDMKLMRRYIALCKKQNPIVPEDLTEYIVGSYCEMRKSARNNKDMTFTSGLASNAIYSNPLFLGEKLFYCPREQINDQSHGEHYSVTKITITF